MIDQFGSGVMDPQDPIALDVLESNVWLRDEHYWRTDFDALVIGQKPMVPRLCPLCRGTWECQCHELPCGNCGNCSLCYGDIPCQFGEGWA